MFDFSIDKKTRAQLDEVQSDLTKLRTRMDALETNMASLRGYVNSKQQSIFKEKAKKPAPKISLEEEAWINSLPETQRNDLLEKLKNYEDDE